MKTAIAAILLAGANAQMPPVPGPAVPPDSSAPAPGSPAEPAPQPDAPTTDSMVEYEPEPTDPTSTEYSSTVVPTSDDPTYAPTSTVDPDPYQPPTSTDDVAYPDKPVETKPVDQYPDDGYDDDVPSYDPPSQEKCGALYVDVLSQYFHYILSHIDPKIVQTLVDLLKDLLTYVQGLDKDYPDTIAQVVTHIQEIGKYAGDHLADDKTRQYVMEAIQKAQDTYSSIYDTSVDPTVYTAWDDLWGSCHNSGSPDTPDPAYAEYVDQYYKAYTGYMEQGYDSPVYQEEIEHLCKSEDDDVAQYGNEVKTAVMQLQSDDSTEEATNGGSGLGVSILAALASGFAMLF